MRLFGYFAFFFLLGISSPAYAQKACTCADMDAHIKTRDFDSLSVYKEVSEKYTAWKFIQSPNLRCRAFGHNLLAKYYLTQVKLEDAELQLKQEFSILKELKCGKSAFAENDLTFGDVYLRMGDYKRALDYYNNAILVLKKSGNWNLYTHALLNASTTQSKLNAEDKSMGLLIAAYPKVMLLPDGISKIDNLYRLSNRYYHHFQVSGNVALLDSSANIANYALLLTKRYNYRNGLILGYNLLENRPYFDHNYKKALLYLDSALMATKPNMDFNDRQGIFADMADIYLEMKQYSKAYQFADSSFVYAGKLNNPFRLKNALELLYNCSKLSGEYERALTVFQELTQMQDSVNKLETLQRYNELEDRYHRVRLAKNLEEYKQDKKLLEQQREIGGLKYKLITVGIIIFTLLAFYLFMVFRQRTIKQKQQQLEMQQRLNRARINPSFIYAALNAIQATSDQAGHSKKLAAFSKLMKQLMESNSDDFFTLERELAFLNTYLELQKATGTRQFEFQFEVDEHIDVDDVCVPTMMLQPFLEYTIEHGFKNIAYEGNISVKFLKTPKDELFIQLQDNGKGLKAVDSTRATQMINDRMYLLNKMNKNSSSYLIRERQSGGVIVDIYLPLITKEYAEQLKAEMD